MMLTFDPCCGSTTRPLTLTFDPCCGSMTRPLTFDPCCGSMTRPLKLTFDPCCGSMTRPLTLTFDPCCGSMTRPRCHTFLSSCTSTSVCSDGSALPHDRLAICLWDKHAHTNVNEESMAGIMRTVLQFLQLNKRHMVTTEKQREHWEI